jgi:hypothetical protein
MTTWNEREGKEGNKEGTKEEVIEKWKSRINEISNGKYENEGRTH